MNRRKRTKHVYGGKYVAEVDVDLIEDDTQWSPYLSLEDAEKLEDIRAALERADLTSASKHARVFALQPIAASR